MVCSYRYEAWIWVKGDRPHPIPRGRGQRKGDRALPKIVFEC